MSKQLDRIRQLAGIHRKSSNTTVSNNSQLDSKTIVNNNLINNASVNKNQINDKKPSNILNEVTLEEATKSEKSSFATIRDINHLIKKSCSYLKKAEALIDERQADNKLPDHVKTMFSTVSSDVKRCLKRLECYTDKKKK